MSQLKTNDGQSHSNMIPDHIKCQTKVYVFGLLNEAVRDQVSIEALAAPLHSIQVESWPQDTIPCSVESTLH